MALIKQTPNTILKHKVPQYNKNTLKKKKRHKHKKHTKPKRESKVTKTIK